MSSRLNYFVRCRFLSVAGLLSFSACDLPPTLVAQTVVEAVNDEPESLLRSMPVNSDERCMGIAMVMEALLEGRRVDGDETVDLALLAREVYASATNGQVLHYSAGVVAREALDKLCTAVADLYKRDYRRALESETDGQRLLAAESDFLTSARQLEAALAADRDRTRAFIGSGRRHFADGTVKETHHAFLLAKAEDGGLIVFDPNDPGKAIRCRYREDRGQLVVQWRAEYRDTGEITTQAYQIVPLAEYLRRGFGK